MASKSKKNNPRWQALAWWKSRNQWRKQYRGKTYTLGPTGVDRCRASHEVAAAIWREKKAEIEAGTPRINQDYILAAEQSRAYWQGVRASLQQQQSKPKGMTVGELADQYINLKLTQAKSKKITIGTYDAARGKIQRILKWTGRDKAVSFFNDVNLEKYYIYLSENAKSNAAAKDSMMYFEVLARYAARQQLIKPLLRIGDKDLDFNSQPKEIEPMPMEDWRQRYEAGNDQVKLYLLLMANCGMYQSDISDLEPSEIDFENGYISRKRSKAKRNYKNAPTVTWKLWPITLELLKKLGSRGGETVLTNRNGGRLKEEWLKRGATRRSTRDNIRTAVRRLEDRQGFSHVQLKRIRKTSTSLLYNSRFVQYAKYFTGQSPTDVMMIHYAKIEQGQFDAAVHWLGQQYGVIDEE